MSDDKTPCVSTTPITEMPSSLKRIKNVALMYLARRDYSRLELYQKLTAKGFDSEHVQLVLEELQQKGYQSDERFAEVFTRSRIRSGDGPFKIKISLREKGICDSLILAVFDKLDIDWSSQLQRIIEKHFGKLPPDNESELFKRIRYLKNKGFYQEHINIVINKLHNQ